MLFNQAVRVPNLTAELRVVDGGHDWDVWGPEFVEGAKYIFQFLNQAPATLMKATLTGTAQEERAGGVAVDAAGNVYQALAAEGSVAGQPYVGDKDLVLVKDSPTGTRLWTRELGTARLERAYGVAIDPAGDVVVTGYTNGDLDGGHAGNTTDDAFVVKFDPAGNRKWLRQFGVPARRRPRLRDRHGRDREHLRHRLHPRQPRRDEPRRQGRLPRQARPERHAALGAAVRERGRGQGLGRRRDRRRCPRRRHDVGRDRHARRRARRLGGALRRRRQPRLAPAVRHGRQRGGLGADGRRRRQHLRRRVLGRVLRRPAGRRQGPRRRDGSTRPAR